ncbi:RNA 2'-phosphotransferase [Desulfovibrio litoralis]|uniref:Probable RNA 2'-phosphotransferase n=1 Tax=Desulfovibrio litoralis DSM 11393 TaxID=1121455 RepID=A0A1M7TH06_9BACT|nr:RNA 2'-phosphotransferase [Desulfovibrio litoralis]SHN69990.1 putative RNA 2'-phosphotransferase [Desulfovibrio litoralis DSM 11393]
MDTTATSKFLSYVLRHDPAHIDLQLDSEGWADVQELIANAQSNGVQLDLTAIHNVLATSSKKRFVFSDDGKKLRALQEHSTPQVNRQFQIMPPPPVLYHGTATRFLQNILQQGLVSKERQYVHLTTEESIAMETGRRYGSPVILSIQAKKMSDAGYTFYLAENDVWLTKHIPPQFITQTAARNNP